MIDHFNGLGKGQVIQTNYEVMVSGVVMYDTDDELIADAIAHNYKTIGWKNVHVKETYE